jgi:hypothetical protein
MHRASGRTRAERPGVCRFWLRWPRLFLESSSNKRFTIVALQTGGGCDRLLLAPARSIETLYR